MYHATINLRNCAEVYLKLREGISQNVECVGVETPHCQDVEMWWIHIFSVAVHINFEFIQELT